MLMAASKDSGLGREGLRYAIEEMTEPKLLAMKSALMPCSRMVIQI